ncbi:Glutathione-dependent formaldehyde-activating enzyme [Rosenbergiella nectarea]|uniref:Glutathione-dependent formaldehyde-activating enzyme n=1 Tax=Rosenbergiella nectarea TaxID=988801 RepID=A0A1H9DAN7_9GAMM|nr:GFA family protein [Rosenbergiella nectarea]SEQ10564.1 Glutathione-dependent formaldehyde-activating enzyme [Rosenbergiella nectarea]
MQGSCLCASVKFTLPYSPTTFDRCHCSLCRRQTGTESNYATLVHSLHFNWSEGEASIHSWRKESGYRNDFCQHCGSTVPNLLAQVPYFWVPLGLVEGVEHYRCVADFCLQRSASPSCSSEIQSYHEPVQSLEQLLSLLQLV